MQIGNVSIDFLGHSGFLIGNGGGKKIAIDPYNVSDNAPKVDLIVISHSHYDHCSIKDIQKLAKEKCVVIIPADAQSKITKIENVEMQVIEVGDEFTWGNFKVEAFPAYNIDKKYHPKNEGWLGFVIKIDNLAIYHAGDSDKIKEMEKLTGYGKHDRKFVALLPVSGETVMSAEEAADVADMLKPDLAIPMHYGSGVVGTIEDAKRFVDICKENGINAQILEKI